MTRDLHSVSSEEPVTHGPIYNMVASLGAKVESLIDKVIGDEVIRDNPELPFSGPIPGDVEHNPVEAREGSAPK